MNKDELKELTLKLYFHKGFGIKSYYSYWEKYKIKDISEYFDIPEVRNIVNSSKIPDGYPGDYLCIWEELFPENLKNISDPPLVLFYRGDLSCLKKDTISIVGTRRITAYGERNTINFSNELASNGLCIVSGMAYGVDTKAHEASVSYPSSSIAVLASAVSEPTPIGNLNIYRNILDSGGLVLSTTAKKVKINKGVFVARNRIIAGLSRATLITEAGIKSGALITANMAFGYSRNVYGIPANINSAVSLGVNSLIMKDIAKLVISPADIMEDLGYNIKTDNKFDVDQNILKTLNYIEVGILESIRKGLNTVDQIVEDLIEIDNNAILSSITKLELKGLIERLPTGFINLKC